jgi:hypothetical protein
VRSVTKEDRKFILERHALFSKNCFGVGKGQQTLSKKRMNRDLAQELGLKLSQVAAVVAWSHPNLGGKDYLSQYIK